MPAETLQFSNPRQLHQAFCGDEMLLEAVEDSLGVSIQARDDWMKIDGPSECTEEAVLFFRTLEAARKQGMQIRSHDFLKMLETVQSGRGSELQDLFENPLVVQTKRKTIVPKTPNQKQYLRNIQAHDIAFGIGPAGTGKTYLAMAAAIEALNTGRVEKLIITRPAVEAGEALGFLPGDLQEKILPYLRPLYDALYDMVGIEETQKLTERNIIEIAPLAYMRGRTLSKAFIILDEAQNTTPEQMMMFLTRLGESSSMVITGDITQVDLPRSKRSGLKEAIQILTGVEGISVFHFSAQDVVRHPLVQRIIRAYEMHQQETP
ncbi:MAG: PhoH family protein [Puniceicoccaceae bacterium]